MRGPGHPGSDWVAGLAQQAHRQAAFHHLVDQHLGWIGLVTRVGQNLLQGHLLEMQA